MRVLIAAFAWLGIGCAGATPSMPAPDFRPSDAPLFDNAVDLVEAPVIVEGDWTGVFERRVGRADLIAVVRVDSLSSDFVSRRSAYRLTVRVKNRLKGSSSKEIVLRVDDDEPGYETVRVNEDRLLHNPFVVFLKWAADPESAEPIPRWHLSPDSDAVRETVDFFLRHPMKDVRT
ncbi:MAG: hypothetical protein WCB63_12405, partial [Polyangiales bacterium]